MEQLDQQENARKGLRQQLQLANDKTISLEEELFESKTVQKELLEELKDSEDKL